MQLKSRSVNLEARERLAQLVKRTRGSKSQRNYGKLIGVSGTTVQGWENKLYVSEAENLTRIAASAGMTLEELMNYLEGKQNVDLIEYFLEQIHVLPLERVVQIGAAVNARFASVAESEELVNFLQLKK